MPHKHVAPNFLYTPHYTGMMQSERKHLALKIPQKREKLGFEESRCQE